MDKANCFNLGHVAKLHGYKGEVSLFFDVTDPNRYKQLDAVFIEINQNLTPFFIEKIQLSGKGFARVKFEGIDSEQDARALLQKQLFLPDSLLPELDDQHFYDHEVIGFEVMDSQYGKVGQITQVIDNAVNPLLQIMSGEKEVLLPLIEGLVQRVDRTSRTLYVTAPAGLIALYLEG